MIIDYNYDYKNILFIYIYITKKNIYIYIYISNYQYILWFNIMMLLIINYY